MIAAPPYVTKLEDVAVAGWKRFGAVWVSHLVDGATGLYARFDWADAAAACEQVGGRLIYADEVVQLHEAAARGEALEPAPVTLPDEALCTAAGVPFDWEHHGAEMEAFLTANMGGFAWAKYHDDEVAKRLAALRAARVAAGLGEGADLPLASGVGKWWVGGVRIGSALYTPPAGRAWLTGWWEAGRLIQPVPAPGSQGPHGATAHHDYATLTVAVSDTEPTS